MGQKERMLYLMHIDWDWIKQRPQYIKESLEKYYDIFTFCPRNYRIKKHCNVYNMKVFYSIPFIRRFRLLWEIDECRKRRIINRLIQKYNPAYVYATHPEYGEMIPPTYTGVVIYDCMDDMLAFHSKSYYIKRATEQETTMVHRADLVLATSGRLKSILCKRYPASIQKFHLVWNGYDGNIAQTQELLKHDKYTLCYFGTISHWFNFDYVLKSLSDFPDLQYLLIGPIEGGTTIPTRDRLMHKPPVKHDELAKETEETDGFIMPFELNDLILSVDPVKLYEYVNFGKDILCVEYPEIKRFDPFVYFYSDYSSYHDQIMIMKNAKSRKYSNEERLDFLAQNSWKHRVESIVSLLNY
jgi:hypothetical protein